MLTIGTAAPAFSLPDQHGEIHSLEAQKGSWVLLYFYPKDDTPGCTKEACGFRDQFADFKKKNVKIFGMSADAIASHHKFAEKFDLTFPLLADPDMTTIKAYEAWGPKTFLGKSYDGILRISYLIDPKGNIAKVYEKVAPAEHSAEVLADVAAY